MALQGASSIHHDHDKTVQQHQHWTNGSDQIPNNTSIETEGGKQLKNDTSNDEKSTNHGETNHHRCPICLEEFNATRPAANLNKCKHTFCLECLRESMRHKPVCPICGMIYGTLKGNQPDGTMSVTRLPLPRLPGYEAFGTIVIDYIFPSGTQGVCTM